MSDSRISERGVDKHLRERIREDEEIFRQRRRVVEALHRLADNEPIVLYNLDRWSRGGFPNLEVMLVDTVVQLARVNKTNFQLTAHIKRSTATILAHGNKPCIGPGCPYCDEEESRS